MQEIEELGPVRPILEDHPVYLVLRYCSRLCWGPNYSLQTMEKISCIDVVWEWVETSVHDEKDEMLDSVLNSEGNDSVGRNETPDDGESAKDGVDAQNIEDMEDAEDAENSSDAQDSDKAEDRLVHLDGAGSELAEELEGSWNSSNINNAPEGKHHAVLRWAFKLTF